MRLQKLQFDEQEIVLLVLRILPEEDISTRFLFGAVPLWCAKIDTLQEMFPLRRGNKK